MDVPRPPLWSKASHFLSPGEQGSGPCNQAPWMLTDSCRPLLLSGDPVRGAVPQGTKADLKVLSHLGRSRPGVRSGTFWDLGSC